MKGLKKKKNWIENSGGIMNATYTSKNIAI